MSNWMSSGRPTSRVWGVAALVQAIADSLQARFSQVVVRGEISGLTRAASGHAYFTLKDEAGGASLRCAMFRRAFSGVDFPLSDGMLVEARGNLAVYEARGELQMIVEGLSRAGAGALFEQFLRLKAKLESEGLFDAQRKRPLPAFPERVAVVTSLAAAALQDVLAAWRRRAPHVEVVVAHCAVQGAEAPAQIVQALADVQHLHRAGTPVDVVVVCRGGGSLEDLWSFNDERVVRAVAACQLPVVSGVGHETDFTLTDFAADLRAPTPTAAAELVCRDRADLQSDLDAMATVLSMRVRRRLDGAQQDLDLLATRLRAPGQVVGSAKQRASVLAHRLDEAVKQHLRWERQALPTLAQRLQRGLVAQASQRAQRLDGMAARLQSVNPQRVLERGYAWVSAQDGHAVTSVSQVEVGQVVQAVLMDGRLDLTVNGKQSA